MTSYAAPATTTFARPATIAAPMTSYAAPTTYAAPMTSYAAPTTYARPATTYAAPITTSAPIRSAPMSYGSTYPSTTLGAPMSYPSTLTSSVGLGAYGGVRSYGAPISYGASYPSTTYAENVFDPRYMLTVQLAAQLFSIACSCFQLSRLGDISGCLVSQSCFRFRFFELPVPPAGFCDNPSRLRAPERGRERSTGAHGA